MFVAAAIVAVLASGCATRGSVRQVESDVTALRKDLAALHQLQEQNSREGARALGELKALETQIRGLNAGVAEASADVGRLRGQMAAAEDALRKVQTELTARPAAVATPTPPGPRSQREASPRPGGPEAAYNAAVATFQAREHGQAVLEFLDFIARYPKHPLAASAQYWIGEAYYVQRDYRQALVEFRKVLEFGAATSKGADALLKIGLCYSNVREPARAQEAWQRLVREYPGSDAAGRARNLLKARRASAR
ncbi:MAG: tol-pal system protein YbgF [Candidatus Rokubacteria bacterium]|nr:tol-pal system protein YbgF [Candidatus Rokubacteria bacterium]